MLWEIWHCRNKRILENTNSDVLSICLKDLNAFFEFRQEEITGRKTKHNFRVLKDIPPSRSLLGFFDGVHNMGLCGARMVLEIKWDHLIRLKLGVGDGTNTKAELLDLWCLLWFVDKRGVEFLHVVDDSKVIID